MLTTSPHTDDIIGYAGPSNLLIALDPQQRVIGVRLLTSGDTQTHVEQVRQASSFWKQFAGWRHAALPLLSSTSKASAAQRSPASPWPKRSSGDSAARSPHCAFPSAVTLAEAQSLFPAAAALKTDDPHPGWHRVLGERSKLARLCRPHVALHRQWPRLPRANRIARGNRAGCKTVAGVVIRRSYDTPEYVDRVREDEEFLKMLTGRTIDEWAKLDFARAGIEGVSGATQTSFAVADGLRRRFAADQAAAPATPRSTAVNPGALGSDRRRPGADLYASPHQPPPANDLASRFDCRVPVLARRSRVTGAARPAGRGMACPGRRRRRSCCWSPSR